MGYITKETGRDAALRDMAAYLTGLGMVKEGYGQAVLDREKVFPTGIPADPIAVAIPHSERDQVIRTVVLVAKAEQEIPFHRIDEPEEEVGVRVIFMLAVDSNQGQLTVITQVMDLIQNPELVDAIARAEEPGQIEEIVRAAFEKTGEATA